MLYIGGGLALLALWYFTQNSSAAAATPVYDVSGNSGSGTNTDTTSDNSDLVDQGANLISDLTNGQSYDPNALGDGFDSSSEAYNSTDFYDA